MTLFKALLYLGIVNFLDYLDNILRFLIFFIHFNNTWGFWIIINNPLFIINGWHWFLSILDVFWGFLMMINIDDNSIYLEYFGWIWIILDDYGLFWTFSDCCGWFQWILEGFEEFGRFWWFVMSLGDVHIFNGLLFSLT